MILMMITMVSMMKMMSMMMIAVGMMVVLVLRLKVINGSRGSYGCCDDGGSKIGVNRLLQLYYVISILPQGSEWTFFFTYEEEP